MDTATVLSELGLSEGETKVYLALLKLGSVPVSKLKEETGLHRTTIYDFIEKLMNKGLVSYVVKTGVNYYSATSPDRLMDFLREKQDHLKQVMPELKKLSEFHKEELKVEVLKGKEGYKTFLNMIINEGKYFYGYGFDDKKYEEHIPSAIRQYFKKMKSRKIKEFIIQKKEVKFTYDKSTAPTTIYKSMPGEYFGPNPIGTFGDIVAIQNWNPMAVIIMKNKDLAKSYKAHFDMLWNNTVRVYRGRDITKAFDEIVEASIKGGTYLCFGASDVSDYLLDYYNGLCIKMQKENVKSRIIYDANAKNQINMSLKYNQEVKTFPKQYITPTEVNITKDMISIMVWTEKEPIGFVIEGKEVADSFRKYFEFMWSIAERYPKK